MTDTRTTIRTTAETEQSDPLEPQPTEEPAPDEEEPKPDEGGEDEKK